ncbi:putative Peptidyl-prolyl cis-trans isomerase-like 2 [Glarea lozoyensis 74030]|uniref:Putative Peptidyl-prolyl cis-trans isomerase-like 2 n=1 Tax=Glarea lozoyensis (strain ATCC 74030 / MF5533) TaxID=1104152 RepID=H0ECK2_GLAL7|nr:putative Peptidyl-prolyl cis-trans isomerase-like 2 [Glarea lozoyensis 74030]
MGKDYTFRVVLLRRVFGQCGLECVAESPKWRILQEVAVQLLRSHEANVFAWETIERLNVKAKMWKDLVDDREFGRSDIITLQDPQNIESRDLSKFKFIKEGETVLTKEQQEERQKGSVNIDALGRVGDKVLRAKEAVEKARREREAGGDVNRSKTLSKTGSGNTAPKPSLIQEKKLAYNAAQPLNDIVMEKVVVFVDPFEEFQKQKHDKDAAEKEREEIKKQGGTEDDKTTWTGKRLRADGTVVQNDQAGGVGKYLRAASEKEAVATSVDDDMQEFEPVKKKIKAGGVQSSSGRILSRTDLSR